MSNCRKKKGSLMNNFKRNLFMYFFFFKKNYFGTILYGWLLLEMKLLSHIYHHQHPFMETRKPIPSKFKHEIDSFPPWSINHPKSRSRYSLLHANSQNVIILRCQISIKYQLHCDLKIVSFPGTASFKYQNTSQV